MNGLDPQAYLADVLDRIQDHKINRLAEILDEDVDLLREIISNDDNLTYGKIISVVTGDDESTAALTDDGVDELRQMLSDPRRSAETWQEFLDCFVLDEDIATRARHIPRGSNRAVTHLAHIVLPLLDAWKGLRARAADLGRKLVADARQSQACRILMSNPDVGAIKATSSLLPLKSRETSGNLGP